MTFLGARWLNRHLFQAFNCGKKEVGNFESAVQSPLSHLFSTVLLRLMKNRSKSGSNKWNSSADVLKLLEVRGQVASLGVSLFRDWLAANGGGSRGVNFTGLVETRAGRGDLKIIFSLAWFVNVVFLHVRCCVYFYWSINYESGAQRGW